MRVHPPNRMIHKEERMPRVWTVVAIAALLAGCHKNQDKGTAPSGVKGGKGGKGPSSFSIPVQVGTVTRGDVVATAELIGSLRAKHRVRLGAETGGLIVAMGLREGDPFEKGDVLVQLCDRDAKIRLNQAQAALAKAERLLADVQKKTRPEVIERLRAAASAQEALWLQSQDRLHRVESLIQDRVATEEELKRARLAEAAGKALLQKAKAELEEAEQGRTAEEIAVAQAEVALRKVAVQAAERELSKTSVTTPFAGAVLQRLAEIGAYVRIGDPLLEIASIDELDVFLGVPERYVARVHVGSPLTLYADVLPDWQLDAKVAAVVPAADPKSRNVPVRVCISNADRKLLPGMFVRAKAVAARRKNVILVPVEAVTPRDEAQVVFVVDAGKARMVPVRVDLIGDGVVSVAGELKVGDTVVTVGGEALFPGAPVTIAGPSAAAAK